MPCPLRSQRLACLVALALGLALTGAARAQSDACASATPIGRGSFLGSTTAATPDGAASCLEGPSQDVWYRFTAPSAGTLLLETCNGSSFLAALSAFTGCPGTPQNQVGCSGSGCGPNRARLIFQTVAGTTYFIRVSGAFPGAAGTFTLGVRFGPDPAVGDIIDMDQFGRVGDTVGCTMSAPLCNVGSVPVDTQHNPDPDHPFFSWNMFRLSADGIRLEQIGQSWAKHMNGAFEDDGCNLECLPTADANFLGPGCHDIYTTQTSANQMFMGPRSEINPWTGRFVYPGSFVSQSIPAADGIERRLQLRDDDLDPDQNPDALYIAEFRVITHDDVDHDNSVAHEQILVSGAPGGVWSFDVNAEPTMIGPAINAWPGAVRTAIPQTPTTDGRAIVAVRTSPGPGGTTHYEYAVYNFDMDRAVWSFSIPVGAATISNIGFRAVPSHGEAYHNLPWTPIRQGPLLTWHTEPFAQNPQSNPIRWGTMYNFWFDASAPPTPSAAALGIYEPGLPSSHSGPIPAPAPACIADFDSSGQIDPTDVARFILTFHTSLQQSTLAADIDHDGAVQPSDVNTFINAWFAAITTGGC